MRRQCAAQAREACSSRRSPPCIFIRPHGLLPSRVPDTLRVSDAHRARRCAVLPDGYALKAMVQATRLTVDGALVTRLLAAKLAAAVAALTVGNRLAPSIAHFSNPLGAG